MFYYRDAGRYIHHSISKNPKAESFPMHAHDQIEIFCFVSGSCKYLVEGSEYYLQEGDIMIMRPSETHNLCVLDDTPYERIVIHILPEVIAAFDPEGILLKPFFDRPLGKYNQYHSEDFPSNLYMLLMSCFKGESVLGNRLECDTKVYAVLGEIYKAYVERMKNVPEDEAVDTSDNAVRIIKYINDHLFEQLSLKEISEIFYISQSQLNRIFRRATGSPVWEYITIKRLIAARSQIQKGVPAGKVCSICGFKDYSSFYRLYKERFGVSPKQDCKIQL